MKKNIFILITFSLMILNYSATSAANWILDKSHSIFVFSINHLMVSDIRGSLKITKGSITTPNLDLYSNKNEHKY